MMPPKVSNITKAKGAQNRWRVEPSDLGALGRWKQGDQRFKASLSYNQSEARWGIPAIVSKKENRKHVLVWIRKLSPGCWGDFLTTFDPATLHLDACYGEALHQCVGRKTLGFAKENKLHFISSKLDGQKNCDIFVYRITYHKGNGEKFIDMDIIFTKRGEMSYFIYLKNKILPRYSVLLMDTRKAHGIKKWNKIK